MITSAQLRSMLSLQDGLNIKVNPNWKTAGYAWHRAIMVEGVELLEHIGWKWWKKQESDVAQAKIELVDIWHFAMSLAMVNDNTEELLTSSEFSMGLLTTMQKVEALVGAAAAGRFNMPAFQGLMNDLGMTWDDLYRIYVGKNILNTFRQDHGYKAGTYLKDWGGVEDNVALEQIMDLNPGITPAGLYGALKDRYSLLG